MHNFNKCGMVGDLHLGKYTSEEWYKTYTDLFQWINKSFKGKTDTIMFLGDVFDGKKEKTTEKGISFRMMEFVSDLFTELSKDFKLIIYAGNHCSYYKHRCDVSALAMLKGRANIEIIEESKDFNVGSKQYRIVPWGCDMRSNNDIVYDAIFAHIDIQTFKMNNVKSSDHGYKTKDLFKVCDTVWTGHYHIKQDRSYQKGAKRVFYAGSPLQLSWNEAGKESYIYLLDLTINDIEEEFINDFSPKYKKIKASKIMDDPSIVNGEIVNVIWDLEHSEENQIKMSSLMNSNKAVSHKNDYSYMVGDSNTNTTEIKDVNDSVDVYDILELHTEVIDGKVDFQKDVNNKASEFLNRVL